MATPNYGYEKRQRELAKKQKKADKERAKAERRLHPDQPDHDAPNASVTGETTPPDARHET